MSEKIRLDNLLVEKGLCPTRSQAQALILAGKVTVNGQKIDKAGALFKATAEVAIAELQKYVSRGGLKLEKALKKFQVSPQGLTCLDIGAATGGFTDCLLQHGAAHVYAVDVGHGQLDWKLRQDPRVTVLEKTNIRHVTLENLPQPLNLAVCDASFISLKKTLPPVVNGGFLAEMPIPQIIALLKPQFEYKDYVDDPQFKGVVRGVDRHQAVIAGVLTDLSALLPGWSLVGLDYSPITGPEGNIEYLVYLQKQANPAFPSLSQAIATVVTNSYADLAPADSD